MTDEPIHKLDKYHVVNRRLERIRSVGVAFLAALAIAGTARAFTAEQADKGR
jgi:hypothetical protein